MKQRVKKEDLLTWCIWYIEIILIDKDQLYICKQP